MQKLDGAIFNSALGGARQASKLEETSGDATARAGGGYPASTQPPAAKALQEDAVAGQDGHFQYGGEQEEHSSLRLPGVNGATHQQGASPPVNGHGDISAPPAGSGAATVPASRSTRNGLPAYDTAAIPSSMSASNVLPPPPPLGAATPKAHSVGMAPPTPLRTTSSVRLDARTPTATSPSKRSSAMTPSKGLSVTSPTRKPGASGARGASRIDPEQVPRPVGAPEVHTRPGGRILETNKYQVPPPASSLCTILDRGSSSCEFVRCTTNQVPAYPSTANTAHVPVAAVCQPFASLTEEEEPVPLVDWGEFGPLRCTRCKAYVCPFFTWLNQGKEASCCLCGQRIEVPEEYFCSLDEKGLRRDYYERPELQRGTVDYVAPKDYSDCVPSPPATVFVLDTSARSVQSGLFAQLVWTVKSLLAFMQGPSSRIAILTFDHAINFYAFNRDAADAQMITVSDIEDPFVPCGMDFLCVRADDECYRPQLEALLDRLLTYYQEQKSEQAAGGAALKAATELLAACGGGHVMMFHATLPNTGIGALRNRDDIKLYGTNEVSSLFQPQQEGFFSAIATECNQKSIGVSVFCAPTTNAYIDFATLSYVPRKTGGEMMLLPAFDLRRDGERLHYAVSRIAMHSAVYGCVFKLRCSRGLQVDNMYATWDAEVIDQSTFTVARLSPDATAVFNISHAERIEGLRNVYLQAACLHTDKSGRRLIRVHTLQLPATLSLSSVFRYTEIDSVTSVLMKLAASTALAGGSGYKEKITKMCVDMLHAYRINCASMTSAGQLILPESLKLLPLFVGSIRKMPAFRSGLEVRADERVAGLLRMLGLPLSLSSPLIYPRVYTVFPLDTRSGISTCIGDHVYLPSTITCSLDKMLPGRMYLVDNGVVIHLYIREEVPSEAIKQFFGVDSGSEIREALTAPDLPPEGARIAAMVEQCRREKSRLPWQPLVVVTPGSPEEPKLFSILAEDCVAGEMPYVEFLCHVHRMVQNKLD